MSTSKNGRPDRRATENAGRRELDKEMERRIQAIETGLGQLAALTNKHLVECSDNYKVMSGSLDDLKQSVDKTVAWAALQMEKARAKALAWEKIKDTVQTDYMVAILKWGPPLIALALIAAVFPAARNLIVVLMETAARAFAGG